MELCLRLVNGRDDETQTREKPSLTHTRHYKYPAVVGKEGSRSVPANTLRKLPPLHVI